MLFGRAVSKTSILRKKITYIAKIPLLNGNRHFNSRLGKDFIKKSPHSLLTCIPSLNGSRRPH